MALPFLTLLDRTMSGLLEQLPDAKDTATPLTGPLPLVCLLPGGFGSLRPFCTGVVLQCSDVVVLCCVQVSSSRPTTRCPTMQVRLRVSDVLAYVEVNVLQN